MSRLLSDKQDWVIDVAYTLTEEDNAILALHPINEASDWKKPVYKPLKDRIRAYYKSLQNGTCCYCRLPINEGSDNVEIEHIIDKNKRLDFTFETRNLVVSCHKCNFAKSIKKVMHTCPPPNDYPTDSSTFKIIHGHYDNYFENIEFISGSFYHGITDEGIFTIDKCKLDRVGLAEQREKVTMYEDDELVSDVLNIRNSKNDPDIIDAMIEKLKALKNQ